MDGRRKICKLMVEANPNFDLYLGDNCIINFHLGRYLIYVLRFVLR